MFDIRYKDREYLKSYDLDVNLFKAFKVEVSDLIPVRKVYVVATNKGNKVLKKVDYSEEDLEFINNIMEKLSSKGFDRALNFEKTKDGKLFYRWKGDMYCLMELIEGRESEYSNPIDLDIVAEAVSKLHSASAGFTTNVVDRDNRRKMLSKFKSSKEKLEFFKKIVLLYEIKNEFDVIFLENVDFYIEKMKKAIELLEKSSYFSLCENLDKVVLCHHDLAHHNILIKDNEAYFVDFDYSICDLRVHDLCNFITKAIKNFAYDMDKCKRILSIYNKENSLAKEEYEVLYAILSFPQDFYSISNSYYSKKKLWDEETFIDKLKHKVSYREEREEFLETFRNFYVG